MEKINLNRNIVQKNSNSQFKKSSFQVNPLDINLAKMQYNLISRLEREVPENRDFAPVIEQYCSKDPTLNLDSVKVVCRHFQDDSPKSDTRCLEVCCVNKGHTAQKTQQLCKGKKSEIRAYVKQPDFFESCKSMAKKIK